MPDRATCVYLRLEPRLKVVARLYSRSSEEARDLAQAGALEVVRQLQNDPGHTDSYLVERAARIIANAAKAERRHGARYEAYGDLTEDQHPPAPEAAPDPAELLAHYRPRLTRVEARVHRARYEQGLTVEETVARTCQARATVHRVQTSIAGKYRESLRRAGILTRSDL